MVWSTGFLVLLHFTQPVAAAPSFDCAKASTLVEQNICADPQLSELDATLAKAYAAKRQTASKSAEQSLIEDERNWLLRRNWACRIPLKGKDEEGIPGGTIPCLIALYEKRIAELQGKPIPDDDDKVELLFSADDVLCKPLQRLYDRLNHVYRFRAYTEGVFRVDLNWEEVYRSQFQAIGFDDPPPAPPGLPDVSFAVRSTWYRADLANRGIEQLVNVEDQPVGQRLDPTFGGNATNLWILKPGASVETEEVGGGPSGPWTVFKPDIVELAVLFAEGPFVGDVFNRYPRIEGPYFFAKIIPKKNSTLPISQKVLLEPAVGGGGVPQVQRLYRVGKDFVITEREEDAALVYRFSGDKSIDDVCYFATSGTLKSFHNTRSTMTKKGG